MLEIPEDITAFTAALSDAEAALDQSFGNHRRQGVTTKSFIYRLFDPRNGETRYIGKANDPDARLKSHYRDARRRSAPVHCWLNALPVQCGMEVVCETDSERWPEDERRIIAEHRENGTRLLNLADGGDQPKASPESNRANAIALNQRMKDKPALAWIRIAKVRIADGIRRGEVSNATRAKLREAAALKPEMFGLWRNLPDREERANGTPL